jgi:hypothetical protein
MRKGKSVAAGSRAGLLVPIFGTGFRSSIPGRFHTGHFYILTAPPAAF